MLYYSKNHRLMKRIALFLIFALTSVLGYAQIINRNGILNEAMRKNIEFVVRGSKYTVPLKLIKNNDTIIPRYSLEEIKKIEAVMKEDMKRIEEAVKGMKMAPLRFASIGLDSSAIAVRFRMIRKGFQEYEDNIQSYMFKGPAYGADDALIAVKRDVDPTDMKIMIKSSDRWLDAKAEYERVKRLLGKQYGKCASYEKIHDDYVNYSSEGDIGFEDGIASYLSRFIARGGYVEVYIQYRRVSWQYVVCVHLYHKR